MYEDFEYLASELKKQINGENFYYVPNPGNWGDGLIRSGTIKFFRDFGFSYKEIRLSIRNWSSWLKPAMKGSTIIYGGGGGWSSDSGNGAKYVKMLNKWFKVIVLPSSFDRHYDYSNTTFFCRDKYESKENMPGAIFCHDMALYLGKINLQIGEGTGYFFRRDHESLEKIDIPDENVDISSKGNYLSEGITFFKQISKYSIIHTDRLHVAIASCLCGRTLHFYPNSYFKNYSVYRSSLKENFDNITFHSEYM